MGGDGSVAVCGEKEDGGGFLLRASREGERLFLLETDGPLTRLTATDTGYAALEKGRVLFTDEDGALCFGTADGKLCRFASDPDSPASYNDDGAKAIASIEEGENE